MFWSKDELSELQASAVCAKIGRAEANDTIRTEILPFVKAHAEAFFSSAEKQLNDDELLTLAHRMGSTSMAYAFDLEQETQNNVDEEGYATEDEEQMPKGMVAMADILNADADYNVGGKRNLGIKLFTDLMLKARLFQEKDSVTMRATRPIRKGEEVMNDYGPLPRADLLRRYGYLTPNYARYDVVELSRDMLLASLKNNHHQIEDHELDSRVCNESFCQSHHFILTASRSPISKTMIKLMTPTFWNAKQETRTIRRAILPSRNFLRIL